MRTEDVTEEMRQAVEELEAKEQKEYQEYQQRFCDNLPDLPVKPPPKIQRAGKIVVPAMTEVRARDILGEAINEGNSIGPCYGHFMVWPHWNGGIVLDSDFTVDELEALAWWLRNFKVAPMV